MAGRRIFVNYRRADAGAAGRLTDALAQRLGRDEVFMDVDAIPPGVDFTQFLWQVVASSAVMLVVIGPEWLTSGSVDGRRRLDNPDDFVRLEIEAGLRRDLPVIPVLIDDARLPSLSDLPESLRPLLTRQAVFLRHSSFQTDVDALAASLAPHVGASPRAGQGRTPVGTSWWTQGLFTWLGKLWSEFVGRKVRPLPPKVGQEAVSEDDVLRRLRDLVVEARHSGIGADKILTCVEKTYSDLLSDGCTIEDLEKNLGLFPSGRTLPVVNARLEVLSWERAVGSQQPRAFVEYLARFPHGTYVSEARAQRDKLIADMGGFDPGTPRIFINYRRVDSQDTADRIYTVLSQAIPPQNITMDVDKKSIVPGLPVETQLERLVCGCDIMFALINNRWLEELRRRESHHEAGEQIDFVRSELRFALARGDAMPVIPILGETVEHPRGADLPDDIRELSKRSSTRLSRDRFSEDTLRLFRQVAAHLGKGNRTEGNAVQQAVEADGRASL